MVVDPKVEAPTRKMLGHAIRNELDDLAAVIGTAPANHAHRRCQP